MIPKLYQKDGTTLIGNLTNCIKCLVEEERNGAFELTLQYPNNETISTSLVYDNIIICDSNDTLKNQKFRIYDTRRMMNNTIEVYARHISFDLAYDHIDSIDITNQSCEYALNTIFRNSQFSTGYKGHSDIINAQNYKIANCNALEAIAGKQGSIIDTYGTGAEILRDNIDIYVYNKRGNDNGVSIEYAKNLTGFELQENTDDLITRIIPFATYTPEGGTQTRVDGPTCNSQYINNYSHPFIAEIDFSDKFEDNEVPTASKLQTLAEKYFNDNKCDLPKQNWKIEFIPLSKCVGYEGIEDAISLCDTVTIIDTRYNIDTKAKVIKTVYDVLRERYDSMELGEPRTTLGDIVNTGSEKGEQGPPGPQGPKGEDGNIGDFPDSLPSKPTLNAKLLGFASIQLDWTYENKPYYWYEVYASKEKDFTPNVFDIVHKGQTSSFLYQAKPGETWYFRVCGINSYDHRGQMSDQIEVVTTLVDNLENYFTTAAIGQAVVGSLTADYMEAGIIKGNWIDAKNLSVTDGNGKRTLDIDSYGNVNLDVTSLKISSKDVATIENLSSNLTNSSIQYYLSKSQTSLTGGRWQDTAPTWEQGKYMWQRMKYTKYDGTVTYGNAVCIAGAKGDTGEQGPQGTSGTDGTNGIDGIDGTDGKGLVSSTPQWYLSTSNTTQTGGSWQDTMPEVTAGKYIWTRFKNIWENPTSTTYTTPVLEQIAESVKDVTKRVKTVEQNFTKEGITTIVGDYYATPTYVSDSISVVDQKADSIKTSITTTLENDYTKKTEFIQTSSDFEFRIHESESRNLMPNSSFEKKETYTRNHNFILDWTKGGGTTAYPESIDGGQYILLYTNDADSYFVKDEAIKIKANTHYTISFYYCASQAMSGSNYLFINGNPVNIPTEYNGDRAWHRHSYTIITNDNVDGITGVRFGCIARGASWLLIDNVQIEEGDTATEYRYKQNEICNGNAFIYHEGIGVAHEDGSYTKMTVSGFKRHIASTGYDYHYLTYIGKIQKTDMSSVIVQLPDEFKGKNFSINLSLEEVANEAGWMIQSFQVLVGAIDYNNATFEVIGGSQSQFHDGTSGQTRPTTVSYIVIA